MKFDRKTWRLIATAGLFLLATVLCIATWAVANAPRSGPDRPKVTDWMQAWGSIAGVFAGLAAAGAATALLLFERRQAREARAELAAQRAESDLTGARLVVATSPEIFMYGPAYVSDVAVTVHNFGPAPILRVFVVIKLFPGADELLPAPANVIPPLSGEARFAVGLETDPMKVPHSDELLLGESAEVTLYFTDATGQGWRKGKVGQPEKVRIAVPPSVQASAPAVSPEGD
ncbi:hypothetical protein ACQPYV_12755 [Micromonospora saelicesensis]|uniref:hypothetical protein n=1 Tax=Micromonospora saelicesensis TaxID=285676 RepID=UPI003D8C20C0